MTIERGSRWMRRVAAMTVAASVLTGAAIAGAPVAASADEVAAVQILTTVGPEGMQHPGIGVTADSLQTAQTAVKERTEPWASYFDAMAMTGYASRTLTPANQGARDGVPALDSFDSQTVNSKFIPDALGAYTQALMYLFTDDPVYRENALKIVRVWSHLDPAKFAEFPDSHIHTGVPLYRMVAAAELLRHTSVVPGSTPYPLEWTQADTDALTANLIVPATETFLHDNSHYFNQHTFPIIGAMSGYIFTDNRARYDEAVEWFTVNASAPDPSINGALSSMFRLIKKSDPVNPYGYSFVQHTEMGRDQAHSGGDVNVLTTLARLVDVQGTKLDPTTGAPSTGKKAVDPYRFLDNRLLKGADAFTGFMMGHDVPWVDVSGGETKLSQWYRGRWSNTLNELYTIYTERGVNVEKIAPYIAEQHRQADGALFFNGNSAEIGTVVGDNGLRSFWGGSDPGAEYWLSLPADTAGTVPPVPADSNLQFETKGAAIDKRSKLVTEGDRTFLRVNPSRDGTTISMRSMSYGPRTSYSPVGVMVRTTDTATLEIRSKLDGNPYQSLTIPNTNGQWRYITYDMDTHVVPLSAMGDNNIVFYTVVGKGKKLDFDFVNALAPGLLTPPRFAQGASTTIIGVVGTAITADLSATDAGGDALAYTAVDAPKRSAYDAGTGAFTWTAKPSEVGDRTFVAQASDGQADTALAVTLRVAANRADAITLAKDGFDDSAVYTSDSLAAYTSAVTAAEALIPGGSADEFAGALTAVRDAVAQLALLNPVRPDGTLDYAKISTSTLGADVIGNLSDDDNATFSGDLFTPSVTIDFGAGYRVAASAFELQARIGFGNRSKGANVYGSNDNVVWTKLTDTQTTNTDALERLAVIDAEKSTPYRFFKVQVDDPGVPTDPNYPGIFSLSELHIDGVRSEVVNAISTATITSSNPLPGRAADGDTVTVAFTSTDDITNVQVTIEGAPATVTGGPRDWTATRVLPDTGAFGQQLAFKVDYATSAGVRADPLVVTTDSTSLYLADDTGFIPDAAAKVTAVALDGEPSPSTTSHVAKMFDSNPGTFSDVGPVNGQYAITLDTGEQASFALNRVEILVRQDSFGPGRASGLFLQGSNDLTTWSKITPNAAPTMGWQNLTVTPNTPFRFVRISNNNWINIAELRLYGQYTAPPASAITTVSTASSNAISNLAVPGDTVTVSFSTATPVSATSVMIEGTAVAGVSNDGRTWTASRVVDAGWSANKKVDFRIDYTDAAGAAGRGTNRTTDASSVYLTRDDGLITGLASGVVAVSPTGSPEPAKDAHVAKLFDRSIGTFTDVGPVGGQFYLILDLGTGETVTVDRAEFLVRQDGNGVSRAASTYLQGSNDLTTWTRITPNATGTLAWQSLASATPGTGFRYVRISSTDWINIAELRLFGTAS
ncbi:hypothetical protein NVV95_18000 [Herbiconiux sp. CPCC 205716]|uniref:Uncharacterized protein n=1 Tax=Herbiconiux gentiana TaxID=2970912 RepID=A0ABT2GJQ2_9MICO|nr:hypothetical protein [Herbiconiux gentiana]MCS5716444.1 hypothetical protein [Herbiconiux gentiana]